MSDESGKRRSFAQRVGTGGENGFRFFAERQGLIPTKVEEDFGIDFIFQVDLDPLSKKSSAIANTFAGACVRATQATDGRVLLYRGDAKNLLNSRTPIVFVLVHSQGSDRVIYHRLVDSTFAMELSDFIGGDAQTMSLTPERCKSEVSFPESLHTLLSHGFSERVKLGLAQRQVERLLPQAGLEIRRAPTGQLTIVTNPEYFEYFDAVHESDILRAAFVSVEGPDKEVLALELKSGLLDSIEALPQPIILAGQVSEEKVILEVSGELGVARAPFVLRRIGTHHGYVSEGEFGLVISHAKDVDGQIVHETQVVLKSTSDRTLNDLGEAVTFLAHCSLDGIITRADARGATGYPISETFGLLPMLCTFVRYWQVCRDISGFSSLKVYLQDALDEETFNSIAVLGALATGTLPISQYSFWIEAESNPTNLDELVEKPVRGEVPLLTRVASANLCVWLEMTATLLMCDGYAVGVKFGAVDAIRVELLEEFSKTTVYPEIVIDPSWPTLAIAPAPLQGQFPDGLPTIEAHFTRR